MAAVRTAATQGRGGGIEVSVASQIAIPLVRPLQLRSRLEGRGDRKVTWLELFLDLGFVAAVAQVVAPLAVDYTPGGVGRCAVLFLLIWWAWSGQSTFATRFDTDDGVQRLLTLLQIFVVAAMAVNAGGALGSRDTRGFIAAYAVLRAVVCVQYLRAARVTEACGLARTYAAGYGVASMLWMIAAGWAGAGGIWWMAALATDALTPVVAERESLHVPPDHAHLPERYGLFTLIMFGESMVAVMRGMAAQADWTLGAAACAFASLAAIFALWSWYFDGADAAAVRPLHTPRDVRAYRTWSLAHVPLCLGLALFGVGLEHAIRVADRGVLAAGPAMLLGAAVCLVMAALGVIAVSDLADGGRRRAQVQVALAVAAAAGLGLVAPFAAPAIVVGGWAVVAAAQSYLSMSARTAPRAPVWLGTEPA